MNDTRRPRFRYDTKSRRLILASIALEEGEIADKLIYTCEVMANIHMDSIEYFAAYPKNNEISHRLSAILYHLRELWQLANFEEDWERRDKFWANALVNSRGEPMPERWQKLKKFNRSIEAAYYHLCRHSEKQLGKTVGKASDDRGSQNGFLRQLSCAYFHVLGRKPGRSKSTIGPFVRFAWAAMRPVFADEMPTIETINERWARQKYDATRTRLDQRAFAEFERDYR